MLLARSAPRLRDSAHPGDANCPICDNTCNGRDQAQNVYPRPPRLRDVRQRLLARLIRQGASLYREGTVYAAQRDTFPTRMFPVAHS